MNFNQSLLFDVGFNVIRKTLSDLAKFYDNKNDFINLLPYKNIKEIRESQQYSEEIINSFIRKNPILISECNNIDKILSSLEIQGKLLDKEEFKDLKSIFISAKFLKDNVIKERFAVWSEIINNI